MDNIVGIWHNPADVSLRELKETGFNGIFVQTDWRADDTWESYFGRMTDMYAEAKRLGFEFILVDFSQGYGEYEKPYPNYNYRKVAEYFEGLPVWFYFGEPVEGYYETGKVNIEELAKLIQERCYLSGHNLVSDSTIRNHEILSSFRYHIAFLGISSYYNQHKLWDRVNFIWIYGQLKFGGSLRYHFLSKQANKQDIDVRFLYQGDPSKFKWGVPYTWLNSLLELLRLRKRFEKWQRKRFIKRFA